MSSLPNEVTGIIIRRDTSWPERVSEVTERVRG
jgi:hypothetical protein